MDTYIVGCYVCSIESRQRERYLYQALDNNVSPVIFFFLHCMFDTTFYIK